MSGQLPAIGYQLSAVSHQLSASGVTRASPVHTRDTGLGDGLKGLAVAFALCVLLEPLGIRLARRLGVIDRPVGDKIHKQPTPLMGGVAIAVAFLVTAGTWHVWTALHEHDPNTALTGLLIGCALAAALGIWDEARTLPPRLHLLGQIGVVLVTLGLNFPIIATISNPLQKISVQGTASQPVLPIIGVLFTVFWIVGMMNTINFLDGLDGLAGGVTAIAAFFLGLWEVVVAGTRYFPSASHDNQNVILPLMLCGAILGFLVYNWAPARVFMGDSGAMFIGFALGALSIFGTAPRIGTALLILIVPIVDVAWAIVRRMAGRRSFASGDKHHIYHRMLELGLSRRAVVLLFYGLCIVLGLIDLKLYKLDKLLAFAIVAVLAAAGAVALEMRGRRAAAQAGVQAGKYGRP